MNPAELLLTGGIALGILVPVTAVVESSRRPVDMTRYQFSENCGPVERCIVDTETGWTLGVTPESEDDQ